MPRKTEWIHQLDTAIPALESLPSPVVDSAALASLLGITPRHARRLLGRWFPQPAGRSLIVLRLDLLERLRALSADPQHTDELQRRERVATQLAGVRRDLQARQVKIAPSPSPPANLAGLPPGITLERHRLEIRFQTAEELLSSLWTLSQTISQDFERFVEFTGDPATQEQALQE